MRTYTCVCMCVCVYVNEVRAHAREFALTRYVYAYTCRNVRPHGSPAHTSGETCERREAGAPRAIGHLTSMAVPLFLTNTIVQQRYHDLRRCLHVQREVRINTRHGNIIVSLKGTLADRSPPPRRRKIISQNIALIKRNFQCCRNAKRNKKKIDYTFINLYVHNRDMKNYTLIPIYFISIPIIL